MALQASHDNLGDWSRSDLGPGRFEPANRKRLSAPAVRTFTAICDLWALTERQRILILGYPAKSTYQSWCSKARQHREITLDVDTLTRISALLGIYQALRVLYANEEEGRAWLLRANTALAFGGERPIDVMTSGTLDAIVSVRRFLDAARGGLYMEPNAADIDFEPYDENDVVFQQG